MCGISFLLDRTGKLGPEAAARMRAATAHRGPDGCGAIQFGDGGPGTVYMGHNRLKIIDLSDEANQPFVSEEGRYALVYNGEIYNYRELRAELEAAGGRFRTQSDTEVLLHLLIREGEAALGKLRGMFAFVFYDSRTGKFLASRDGAGIKPLYFTQSEAGLAICSEIPGLLASGLLIPIFEALQILPFLRTRYASSLASCWESCYELSPGRALTREGERAVQRGTTTFSAQPSAALEELLRQSLTRHLTADVPVGLWLSGGVDSTLLLALAREMGHQMPCFSIALRTEEGSFGSEDRRYAREAAKLYEAEYHEFEASDEILNNTDEALTALGQPIADTSVLLTWWLARQTSREVKAVLSGAGADEWFAGYNRHRAYAWWWRNRKWLKPGSPSLRMLGKVLPTAYDLPGRKQLRLARQLLTRLRRTEYATFQQFFALDDQLLRLLRGPVADFSFPELRVTESHLLNHDRFDYLPHDILALTDQTSMRHGLEVRTPYLDQDLTAYVSTIPAKELLRHGPKWMLRELLDQRGGQAFTKRSKEGFGLPITRWLRMPKYQWLFDPIRRRDHPLFEHLDYDRTQEFLKRFQTGRHDLGTEAWALITLFRWYDLKITE